MGYKYFEIEFEDSGDFAYIEETSMSKAKVAAKQIGGCKLTGAIVGEETAFYNEYDIY